MSQSEQKIVQYINEAHASEVSLVSVLQSQIAISPQGSYREGLEKHLDETRDHARRLRERLEDLGQGGNPFQAIVGFSETVIGQMIALSKAPFDLWRGSSGAEKVLKDAKDACASEALEIATYTALERLATQVGDTQTARLAASIRRDEERMLGRIMREIPKLTDAVAEAEIEEPVSAEVTQTGAGQRARGGARQANHASRARKSSRSSTAARPSKSSRTSSRANKTTRATRTTRADEAPRAETTESKTGARAGATTGQARPAAQSDNGERRDAAPARRESRGNEPWPGYDQLSVAEIEAVLNEGDLQRAQAVADYERAHKNRPEVVRSAMIPARFLLSSASR